MNASNWRETFTYGELEAWILLELRRRAIAQVRKEQKEADDLMLYGDGKPGKFLPLCSRFLSLQREKLK